MGPFESDVYRKETKNWSELRRRTSDENEASIREFTSGARGRSYTDLSRSRMDSGLDAETSVRPNVDGAHAVATKLMLAKAVDGCQGLGHAIRCAAPVVAFDVYDSTTLRLVEAHWRAVILGAPGAHTTSLDSEHSPLAAQKSSGGVVHLVVWEPPKATSRLTNQVDALAAVSAARPVLAFSPLAETHLPDALLRICDYKIAIGSPDFDTIAKTIRIVTGGRTRATLEPELLAKVGIEEIALAVRFDRSADECMRRLRELTSSLVAQADVRELTLSELHGMGAATEFAKSFVHSVEAWRRGEIPWSAVEGGTGVCFDGPPGVGKSTLCRLIARESKLEILVASHSRWQSAGEGHLGHFLREMRRDHAEACRMAQKAPILFLVEELDSFTDRATINHSHRDYALQATAAFLSMVDGLPEGAGLRGRALTERPRIAFLATTNNSSRCDPAVLRPGRFGRVIHIGLPDHEELERMMRVRLRGDLADADLHDLAVAAAGCTGADIERLVADARRIARREGRPLAANDLRRAFAGGNEVPEALLPRIAAHEAGHILVDVLLHGPMGAVATMTALGERAAASFRLREVPNAGTFADRFRRLQVLLAGHAAEEARFAEASGGWSGTSGSDLHQATAEAAALVGSYCLAGPRFLYLGAADATSNLLIFPEVRAESAQLLARARSACVRLISENRAALDEVAARLLAKGNIEGLEVARIVADCGGRAPAKARAKGFERKLGRNGNE
ncbi:ATP-binding protein [Bradyrhizobium sp. WYCCWR 13022]|uniref:ATP-binding protein n=1 Tax=unclassified Bradyrhizobium TaxID=2631580 RepID=UPI00263AF33A|nr:ATP-binding protein [Bradyrhizobium sp. WYCCWR 13022]MDN4985567.1 ATP-binding protein [Bradyrhizobium sp. WYCCWR 13022]